MIMFAVDPSTLLASDPLLPRHTNTNSSFHPSTLAQKKKKKINRLWGKVSSLYCKVSSWFDTFGNLYFIDLAQFITV